MPSDERVHLERRGAGPPLLLIHGIGHRWQAWEPVLDRLAAEHEVFAVDLPGFGESPLPAGGAPRDVAGMVARLRALCDERDLGRPHVAGNSLGGALALELGAAGAAASVTALSPAGFYTGRERRRAAVLMGAMRLQSGMPLPLLRAALRRPVLRYRNLRLLAAHPERLDFERVLGDTLALRRARGFRPVACALKRYRFTPADDAAAPAGGAAGEPPSAAAPVTVAWGERDRILPPRQAARARARLPAARHVWLPGCGHVPMSDDPELVAHTILATTGALTAGASETAPPER